LARFEIRFRLHQTAGENQLLVEVEKLLDDVEPRADLTPCFRG
jgi:hypothetical protein